MYTPLSHSVGHVGIRVVSEVRLTLYSSSTNRSPMMLAIRLPADVEERLDRLAKATGRTKTFHAREAILEYLDELEDLYLAEQRPKE